MKSFHNISETYKEEGFPQMMIIIITMIINVSCGYFVFETEIQGQVLDIKEIVQLYFYYQKCEISIRAKETDFLE